MLERRHPRETAAADTQAPADDDPEFRHEEVAWFDEPGAWQEALQLPEFTGVPDPLYDGFASYDDVSRDRDA